MTPNDVQIDVLMRRYAKHTSGASSPEHLDVDELSAFAEGSLPAPARARYVSHLADCDNCRQLVSQLAMSAGTTMTEPAGAIGGERISWSQKLSAFFAPRTLRYAAFAVVLVAAVGVVFLVSRRSVNDSALVAQNEQRSQTTAAEEALKPKLAAPQASVEARQDTNRNAATGDSPVLKESRERDESKAASVQQPASPQATTSTSFPELAAKKSAEPAKTESQPSYAPPPPGETQGLEARSRQKQGGADVATGPRKTDSLDDKYKAADRPAASTLAKDRSADESNRGAMNQAPQSNSRIAQEKRGGPRRGMDNIAQTQRNEQELRVQVPKTAPSVTAGTVTSEEAPETRSAGGRKFRKQGSAWIDLKFKSSMSVKSIARGSEEFDSLDSGLRSIAAQLPGEIIVVWKSKAYRIR